MLIKYFLFALLLIVVGIVVYNIYKIIKIRREESLFKDVKVLQELGKTDEAVRILEKDVALNFSEKAFLALINILLASEKYDKAVELFEQIEKKKKHTFSTSVVWAYTKFLKKDHKGALNIYDKLLKKYPENSSVIKSNIAAIYIEQGKNLDEAENIYIDILKDPNFKTKYNIYINLGLTQLKLKKFNDAILNAQVALELIPKKDSVSSLFGMAHYILGISKYNLKDWQTAKNELELAMRYNDHKEFIKKIDPILNIINNHI
jgi:tetratricopeptide (TPR) repeat protein